MKIRRTQMDALRNAGLDRFRRERLLQLRQRGFEVEEDEAAGEIIVRDACSGEARVKSQGATASITSAEGRTVVTEQHPTGRINRISDGAGHEVQIERDRDGTLKTIDRGDGSIYRFSIAANDKCIIYPDGSATRTEFYDRGKPKTVTDRNGNKIQYEYIDAGLLTGIVDARGNRTQLIYDEWDSPSAIEYANGMRHEFEYDSNGRLRLMRANGQDHARYHYDEATGEYDVEFRDGTAAHFVLEGKNIKEATNETGTVRFTYDGAGRLLEEDANGQVVRYLRNDVGAIVAIVTPAGETIQFKRDRDQRLSGIVDWEGQHYTISNAPAGPPTAIRYPNGVTLSTPMTAMGLCESWTLSGTTSAGRGIVDSHRFEYDTCDRITADRRSNERRTYRYDKVGRLLQVESAKPEFTERFELDANGNRVQDAAGTSEYDPANQLLRHGSRSFSYDELGNTKSITGEGSQSYTWNARGQLVAARTAQGLVRYAYDAIGRRIRKEIGGRVTEYVWAGTQLLAETTFNGDSTRRRDYLVCPDRPGAPLAMRDGPNVYYLHAGRLHEVRCATDRRGRVVWNADYLAFGKAILSVHEIEQPWRYAGHYLERETGLHYAVARYYAPALGRYLSRDPLLVEGGSLNFYTYCDGDPLNRIDPTGEIGAILSAVVIGAVVGAVVGAAIGAGVEMYRQRNEKNFDWGKIGKSALIGGAIGLIGGALGAGLEAAMVATAGVLAAGAIAGGVGAGVEYCLEVAFTDAEWSWEDLRTSVVIGVGVGAVTAGIGGIIAARAARRAAREAAKELAEQAAKEAAERAAKEAAEQAAKEAAEQAAKEAAERAAKEAARQTLADEVAEEARRVINSGASKNALRRGAAVSKATLGEYSSRIYQNIYVKITKCPGAVLDEAEGVLRITDVDAYIGEVRRLYAEAGNELNPIIEQRIRAQIANNPALDPTRGLPGLHAEVQAANDVLNQAGEDAALDAVDIATSKITPMEGQGGAFPACENCSGILDSSHIVTGSAE